MSDPAEPTAGVFDCLVRDGVCRLRRPETRWLSTGHAGGESVGPVAYNVSVPEGWAERDVDGYVARRLADAGFDADGPALLTGVSMRHARVARLGPVEAVVTAGVDNPAALPVSEEKTAGDGGSDADTDATPAGTVNVFVGTTRALEPGALENLVALAAEAKAATLVSRTGVPGTTTDAVVAACDPAGDAAAYSGSATEVGAAARACVRDALLAALDSRYADEDPPASVAEAEHGVVTDETAAVSRPPGADR
ncbi:adenosylcobinamide amidohydrolase [Halopelagius longus]|uniref:Adenosylcobinamide amidohydrolase n=1 Tax=Halopelagius longus TaxID=1236180 RepID=A0A1H1DK99_9EURY|nr:adenosylcobinamide amidohydrolase [Halopelagius longus]RDI71348.1 adenosylcobinamide amidohydrolase [Halopelagius longus]SDQ76296.1 adenosylcobinamide hydrolase [Halopelagius longus]